MTITELPITGARLLAGAPARDARGSFEVFWEAADLAAVGISFAPANAHHSYNDRAGTLRGMHYQRALHGQVKLVSCVRGKILDVIVDVRPASPTYLRWAAVELAAASGRAVYIPSGCAHGFLTLEDHSTVAYLIENDYRPEATATLRWNDPRFGIQWPVSEPILSERDRFAPDFQP
jgi:dTDP-4-dehydrorhamnose 3,5-epimerase